MSNGADRRLEDINGQTQHRHIEPFLNHQNVPGLVAVLSLTWISWGGGYVKSNLDNLRHTSAITTCQHIGHN